MSTTLKKKASDDAPRYPVKLLNTEQSATVLAMGKRTLQELVAAREIGVIKIGKSVRFHPDDINEFIERNRVKAMGWKGKSI